MSWERQFESMIQHGHLDDESNLDLGIAYAAETGDESMVGQTFVLAIVFGISIAIADQRRRSRAFSDGKSVGRHGSRSGARLWAHHDSISCGSSIRPSRAATYGSTGLRGTRLVSLSNGLPGSYSASNHSHYSFSKSNAGQARFWR